MSVSLLLKPSHSWSTYSRRLCCALGILVWAAAVACGFVVLGRYQSVAAPAVSPPPVYPSSASVTLNAHQPTLLMFAHPHCACTRASLNELAATIAHCPELLPAHVIFSVPTVSNSSSSDLVQAANGMTGVVVTWDVDQKLAKQFGVVASGHVLLYDADGQLQFSGGITALRGHEGWSDGRAAIEQLAHHERAAVSATPVFGCSLFTPAAERAQ